MNASKICLNFHKQKYVAPKITVTPFSDLKLGKYINGGVQSSVYDLKGFKSLVVKTNKFEPETLKWEFDSYTHSLLSSENNATIVMEKVSGTPLHGKGWVMGETPFITAFKYNLRKLLGLPESAYVSYINKVIELRKNGYDIDRVNPNNILYDRKNRSFNIVDIKKSSIVPQGLSIDDFAPFWDDIRLLNIYDKANFISKIQIAKLVRKLMEKVCAISDKCGYKVEVQPIDKYSIQRPSVYFYHKTPKRADDILKNPYLREIYLLRIDD